MTVEQLYGRLPVSIQNAICSLQGWKIQKTRYSSSFWKMFTAVQARGSAGLLGAEVFRDIRLNSFVRHSVETVPYYQDLFKKLGLRPEDIKTLDDLKALPVLNKAQVQDEPERFRSDVISERALISVHTSGTTGSGLQFLSTAEAQHELWAVWWRYWDWHGIRPGTWSANFGWRPIVPVAQDRPPFWRINHPGRQILFSAYHATPENLSHYLNELRMRQPPWLHGFPSQLAVLASHLLETGFELGYQPRWITIGAENLLPHQVALIEAAFGRAPLQHYGMAEAIANISQCELGRLHVDEDFAAVEFLETGQEDIYRIVGTNMSNLATPLLRYEVGDQAELSLQSCLCGRPGRIVKTIDGRKDDYVITATGAKVGRLGNVFKDLEGVREAQIRQSKPGEVTVLIVKSARYHDGDEAEMRRQFASRLGSSMKVNVAYVQAIERTKRGKLRFVVNDIPAGAIDEIEKP
ncbi:hypothetical protein sphantq_04708 (plasmid) [Sphingobium sp. AntQ-1]|uniref:phenylacetate--CoA ligase family protein n=1 Tax=Sphingobium sp. AntQ-1 TaxID=2930091 RepID=UPI00234E6228|nr:hypothetical protein [Sphingobium sp. AntQ-1]WCP16212.1 hypothetical protein sphantq_04708 [Sphingobium sp. AntQ-1]